MISLADYINGQKCFVVVKPGFLDLAQKVIEEFEDAGWSIFATKTKKLLLPESHELYKPHEKEDFYEDLCKYMSSGLSMGIIFTRPGALGEGFKTVDALKDKLRKEYGESDMRNLMHSSDNLERARIESQVYFNKGMI